MLEISYALKEQIEELRSRDNGVEDGAVMFYSSTSCPENWAKLNDFGGYYLRIQKNGETIGSIKEQIVHRHKHVSPYSEHNSDAMSNSHPYRPLLYCPNIVFLAAPVHEGTLFAMS